ncbi:Predicted kinase, aminoglycoside phosphotransferase (APT) family [Rhizobiales bacterium GAS191]|jgi:aminoglycoside phosphotransferase (APT) family kinase protein|nr:Predicted kinase, aminoglycoside phosphotransferase (APT) family [Rhizobiales bacterium GAS113]SED57802.1 Predicted kinase, aminoglycoside phosphotransferase (APT) family [Rhizobiales bacterium GAS188]SEE88584.1 Predicted kinase, aminoglycoside phosphotransferase (APT) family [Rhizobiales bacterium GAS191]
MSTQAVLVEPLPQHRLDAGALDRYLGLHVEGYRGPARIRQFQGGQSNPTFLIETPDAAYVLRKKPPGKLLASAHMVEREYKVQKALAGSAVPVAPMLVLCEDADIVGTPFYLMGHVAGRIIPTADLPDIAPGDRAAIYRSLIETLAALHKVDWRAVGLGDFGRPDNYAARQIDRWTKQYAASRTDDIPEMEKLSAWLVARVPASADSTIVHGDYRVGNTIIAPAEPRLAAVLDWELATIGDPLADLAYLCMAYSMPPGGPGVSGGLEGVGLAGLGIPSEDEVLAAYARATSRPEIPHWSFYKALAFFRIAAIVQGVYARGLAGNAADSSAIQQGERVRMMAQTGWAIAARAQD